MQNPTFFPQLSGLSCILNSVLSSYIAHLASAVGHKGLFCIQRICILCTVFCRNSMMAVCYSEHSSYVCPYRRSPEWMVSAAALKACPSERVCSLALPRMPADGWQPERPLLATVSKCTASYNALLHCWNKTPQFYSEAQTELKYATWCSCWYLDEILITCKSMRSE